MTDNSIITDMHFRFEKMPSRSGPTGISRALTPEQTHLLESTWGRTQTPSHDEVLILHRHTGLTTAKVYILA